MKKIYIILGLILIGGLGYFSYPSVKFGATTLFPSGGGTGINSATAGDVGDCLSVADDSPFTYAFSGCAGGSGSDGYGFITDSYGGTTVQSTTSPIWLKGTTPYSLLASSTLFTYSSTTYGSFATASSTTGLFGQVGIGTTPSFRFHLKGALSSEYAIARFENNNSKLLDFGVGGSGTASPYAGNAYFSTGSVASEGMLFFADGTSGFIDFYTSGSGSGNRRMRVNDTGVGVASTTPWKSLSVGSTNTGTFAISTSTDGCAQFTKGELWATGSDCGTGSSSNYLTNSGVNTYLNTGTFLQAPAITATSSTATSTIANLSNKFYVPADFSTNGCAGNSSATTFDTCVEAIYALAATKGLTGAEIWVTNNVTQAQWTSTINFETAGVTPSLMCSAGVTLKYGGSGNAILLNFGQQFGQQQGEFANCTYMGQNTLIKAGDTNSTTTVGIYFGGANGVNGFNIRNNKFNGFGTQVEIGANAYMLHFTGNGFSGGNGQASRGSLVHINAASNSGERNNFIGNRFTDPGNSYATSSVYITNTGTASNFFSFNSFDDAGVYVGASNGKTVFDSNHWEWSAPATYPMYNLIYNPSSDQSTHISFTNNEIVNSGTGATSFHTLIRHGAQVYAAGNNINNYNGGTITYFIDHRENNGTSSELVCNTNVMGGTLTNIIVNRSYSQSIGVGCWQGVSNSWPIGMYQLSTNVAHIVNGNQSVATFADTGNWVFGGAAGDVSVTNDLTVGLTLGVTGVSTLSGGARISTSTNPLAGPLVSFSSTLPQLSLSAGTGQPQWTLRNAGGSFFISSTTVAGTATTSTSAFSILNTGEVVVRHLFQIFSVAGTKLMDVAANVVTLLGTWDFSGATVKEHTYSSFSYATSTTWTATTTIPLGPAYTSESWTGVKCFTDTGTLNVSFNDGTNRMDMFNASTTVGNVLFTTNNTFTASEKRYVDIGTPASSPTKISCTTDKIVNN